jgi:hypothetical protein
MLHAILTAPWQQAIDVLSSGNPPMILFILAINTVVLILFTIRRMRGFAVMPTRTAILVQSLLVAANLMILYQAEIEHFIRKIII